MRGRLPRFVMVRRVGGSARDWRTARLLGMRRRRRCAPVLAVSVMRAAILISRIRSVVNSALARACGSGDRITHREHQPVGTGVQYEAYLVGERRPATGAVGGQLGLVQLDQVLGLAAGTVQGVVEPLGAATREVGDHVANVQPLRGGLDARRHASLRSARTWRRSGSRCSGARSPPRPSARRTRTSSAASSTRAVKHGVARQAEDIVDAVGLAPSHHFGTAVMAIAPDGQLRARPVADECGAPGDADGRGSRPRTGFCRRAAAPPRGARSPCHRHGSAESSARRSAR